MTPKNKVIIAQQINQANYNLVGYVYSNKEGKIHFIAIEDGLRSVFQEKDILDLQQVGLLRSKQNTKQT